ncbi:MAG: MFS transporter, partial [Actinobacteria bacterium]|nr:MFS transporter [Actinomycetota bacterium]
LAAVVATRIIHQTLRYKWIPVVGSFLLIVGTLGLSRLEYDSSFSHIIVGAIVFGFGLGCLMQPLMLAVQNALPAKDNGAGTASVMFSRQIGGSLGAAVFLSILFGTVQERIKDAFLRAAETPAFQSATTDPAVLSSGKNGAVLQALSTGDLAQAEAAGVSLDDTSFLQDLHPQIAAPFRIGFSDAINGVMLIAAVIIAFAFIVSFFLPSIRLSEKSGLENLLDERAAEAEAEAILAGESGLVAPASARVRSHRPNG